MEITDEQYYAFSRALISMRDKEGISIRFVRVMQTLYKLGFLDFDCKIDIEYEYNAQF